jgi:uncharacterized membrane protein
MNKKFKLAFLVSLILNVVLIGIFLGQSPRRFDRNAIRQERMEQALKGLPADAQSRLSEKFSQLRATAKPLFDQIGAAQDEAVGILRAEPFDESTYDRQINKIDQLRTQTTERLAKIAKDTALSLSGEERRRFADMLRRPQATDRKK